MRTGTGRRPLIAGIACVALLSSLGGCGGSGSTTHRAAAPQTSGPSTPSQPPRSALTVWANQTQQLCTVKKAAIARLGYVNITYAGIARVGLPAVKRSLDAYLGRLLALLRDFHQRQQRVSTPQSVAPAMRTAAALDLQSQAATQELQAAVANVQTAGQLSAAFKVWTDTLQRLSARGVALAKQLNLPACQS